MRTGTLSDKSVIANCPIYQPVPMKFVTKVLKQKNEQVKTNFNGIKRVKRSIPARPMNINALAVALSNISEKNLTQTRTAILTELPTNAFADDHTYPPDGLINTPARRFGPQTTPIALRTRSYSTTSLSELSSAERGALASRVHLENSAGAREHSRNFRRELEERQVVQSHFPEL